MAATSSGTLAVLARNPYHWALGREKKVEK
jgi:hypothetical protein